MSSSQENTRKISKQFLFFDVILVRSNVTIMTSKKKQVCFHLSKNADTRHNSFCMEWEYCMIFILWFGALG